MTKYYTLLRRYPPTPKWMIEFGDYQRSVVQSELDDYHHSHESVPRKHMKIIVTHDDTQTSIDKLVSEINEAEAINAKAR